MKTFLSVLTLACIVAEAAGFAVGLALPALPFHCDPAAVFAGFCLAMITLVATTDYRRSRRSRLARRPSAIAKAAHPLAA